MSILTAVPLLGLMFRLAREALLPARLAGDRALVDRNLPLPPSSGNDSPGSAGSPTSVPLAPCASVTCDPTTVRAEDATRATSARTDDQAGRGSALSFRLWMTSSTMP